MEEWRRLGGDDPAAHDLRAQGDAAGRYRIAGLAARMEVGYHVVERWVRRGLVTGTRTDHGQHKNVWWLDVDDATLRRLQPESLRQRRRYRRPLPDRFPDGRYSV